MSMQFSFGHNPALTVAIAMAAGVIAQSLARHLRIPGIVLLLVAGVVLGPDLANIVQPETLGHGLEILIGFAVAVILFDGGLNLHLDRMRRQAPAIQRLLTVGVIVTTAGGALAARYWLGWSWTPSLLFGTLVIVTGPTVVTPLLRRIRVRRSVETILESEGVLIDAVGAVVAVVALEIALGSSLTAGALSAPMRLLAGLAIGGVGGGIMGLLLRWRQVVPAGFETIFTLSFTLAIYQFSNALTPESGIMAAIAAGAVVGHSKARSDREIREFKEQLTTLLIGMLFVLLAADVRVTEVVALGWPGVLVVFTLMFVVRPINILLCTWRTGLDWREKSFLSWVAPRGIVAAAVASLFAERLDAAGDQIGGQLRALVFLVITGTVVAQGATAGLMAHWLKVRRPGAKGFAILGANPLGRLLGRLLQERGQEVVLLDSNAGLCSEAEADGLKVLFGNAMNETVQLRAQMDTRRAAIGLTHNEAVNLLFAKKVKEDSKVPRAYSAGDHHHSGVTPEHLKAADVRLLFGNETDTEMWAVRVRRDLVRTESWSRVDGSTGTEGSLPRELRSVVLPLFVEGKDRKLEPVDCETEFDEGKIVLWLLMDERIEEARSWLTEQGWQAAPDEPAEADTGTSIE
jgi:NhaP-type Na+/H+ or K+/H+ antiporter